MHSCNKSELRKFKLRAGKRHPAAEYVETLWGTCDGLICDIRIIQPVRHRGTKFTCKISDHGWAEYLEEIARNTGLDYLGTIHTHDWDENQPQPSTADNTSAVQTGERIFAIDSIKVLPSGRKQHTVKFWFPQTPISNIEIK